MAAPTVGSSVAGSSNGSRLDTQLGSTRILADGSFATVGSSAAGIWNYKSLTASGTTVVKSGAGQLRALITGTATGNVTIYDNTAASGTKILDACALLVGTITFDVSFGTGLTVVLSGAGVASVTYL
jgi:hypothetical protein